jgi:ABC-type multidrug transport system fused ATPase/permease subunit
MHLVGWYLDHQHLLRLALSANTLLSRQHTHTHKRQTGAFGIGQVNADMGAQKEGQQAAARVFALSDDTYKIDPLSEAGAKPEGLSGAISFRGIKFAYPTRPSQMIYGGPLAPEGFNLEVKAGDTVALVSHTFN